MDIHHIGIVVSNIEALKAFIPLLPEWKVESEFSFMGEKLLFVQTHSLIIEFIEGDPTPYPFHIAYQVPNLETHMQTWKPPASYKPCGPFVLENGWKTVFYSHHEDYIEFIEAT
ncbi:hypothetical protein [Halalkalibacter okhensis]|uniref:VOC domain-containing protein n=1 Tax=Halalkalibacter okhensis TaxID=333138 RepID=A0A0B0IFQ6_9BACI|nr:hypothetical protein [Halalkalibacter okhensis]KHF39722.1 hypothetical protein LQ50_13950 [Halalkalibacter okhensis]